MLQVVDRTAKHTIQKVTGPKSVSYQTIETAKIGKGGQAETFFSLREARESVGRVIRHPVKETAPESSYAKQQKSKTPTKTA